MTKDELYEQCCAEAGITLSRRWSKASKFYHLFSALYEKTSPTPETTQKPKPGNEDALEGWKEATIAWTVCGSIHRGYCKGKDPLFNMRQADFVKSEEQARTKYKELDT